VAGVTLVDLYAALRREVSPPPSRAWVPTESWRGSGLAEDVGVGVATAESAESEEARQRMMEEAARKLGLPELPEDPEPRHRT
jgi:hypothetical protein